MVTLSESCSSQLKQELYTLTTFCQIVLDSGHDSSVARKVIELVRNRQFEEYLDLDINPNDYTDPQYFADDWQIVKMLSKSPNLPIDCDRRLEAELSYLDSEITCHASNAFHASVAEVEEPLWLWDMKQIIARVLPELTKHELERVACGFSHGPGSTTGVKGMGSCVVEKYDSKIHHTAELTPFLDAILGDIWAKIQTSTEVVRGGVFTTVPKKALTDRGIIIPPTANMYVQKGIGKRIRRHLKAFGLDLNRQQTKNAAFAKRAWTDKLATIDLSAASDSICSKVVEKVLPRDWFALLDWARETEVYFASDWRPMHKFSAMGNGFTFELETLLFWALCKSVIPSHRHCDIAVYGDDIIVPQQDAEAVIEALNYLGFSVNDSKSFLAGSFFESCGTDWFKGVNVRPFYLKGAVENVPYSVTIANRVRLYANVRGFGVFCDSRYETLWTNLYKVSPVKWQRCIVPEDLGDVGFIGTKDECKNIRRTESQLEGYYVKTMSARAVKRPYFTVGVLLDKLSQCGKTTDFPGGNVTSVKLRGLETIPVASMFATYAVRGEMRSPKPRWTLVLEWPSSFDWLTFDQPRLTISTQ